MPPRGQRLRDEPLVRTSVRFPRDLLKQARIRAATDECSFQSLLITALETELSKRDRAEAKRSRRPSKHA